MNKYEQLGVAGEGAYGVVLKCRHKDSGAVVAIKRFKESEEEDEAARKVMQREVKLLRSLKHKHIIEMKEAFRQKGLLYLVFEYVEKSLMDLLESNPKGVGVDRVRMLTHQLTSALEHCHKSNVIHRDIKPENLLISSTGDSLRLCDFGSARKLGSSGSPMTDYVSTRWYRAPELLLSTDNYSKSVDMWGTACVAAELSDGQPLFAGQTDLDQLSIIQKALGPLTPNQVARYLELSDFRETKFPVKSSQTDLLESRFGRQSPGEQLEFLRGILRMDPSQRLTATAALNLQWFRCLTGHAETASKSTPMGNSGRDSSRGRTVPQLRATRTPSPAEEVESESEHSWSSQPSSRPQSSQLVQLDAGSPSTRSAVQASPCPPASQLASRSSLAPRPESSTRRSLALPRAEARAAGAGSRPLSGLQRPPPRPDSGRASGSMGHCPSPSACASSVPNSLGLPASVSSSRAQLPDSARSASVSALSRSAQRVRSSSSDSLQACRVPDSREVSRCEQLEPPEELSGISGSSCASEQQGLNSRRGSLGQSSALCTSRMSEGPERKPLPAVAIQRASSEPDPQGDSFCPGTARSYSSSPAHPSFHSQSSNSSLEAPPSSTISPAVEKVLAVGICSAVGKASLSHRANMAEASDVSYTSILETGRGHSKQLHSTWSGSITEEIDSARAPLPEEVEECSTSCQRDQARGQGFLQQPEAKMQGAQAPAGGVAPAICSKRPSFCAVACAAGPRSDSACKTLSVGMAPATKLGLIQRKGTRWKVS